MLLKRSSSPAKHRLRRVLHRFDVSPDERCVLFERVRENSDVVLIETPER